MTQTQPSNPGHISGHPSMVSGHFSPVELSLDQCIKCNICTTACPVAAVTDLFPGPKYEAPQGGRFRAGGQASPDQSVDYCSGCRVCNMICPTGVKIAEMNARARATFVEQGHVHPIRRLRNNVMARTELLGTFAQPVAPLANFVFTFKPARWVFEKTFGVAQDAYFPPFCREKFTTWWRKHQMKAQRQRTDNGTGSSSVGARRSVVYFHGCSTQYYEPRVGRAAVRVLEALGYEVIIPKQNCCGLPLLSNGEFPAARKAHESNVASLVEYARQGIPIVGTSTSCTLTLKEEAPELLDMHDEATRLVAENTYDFNEFLLKHWATSGEAVPALRPIPLTLPYHIPCQYRGHRLGKPGVEVLDLIPGLRTVDSHASCCGIAGTYGYKVEKYSIAQAVGEPLFEFIRESDAPLAICDSETCRWQITGSTGKPAVHPVELLAAAMGFEAEGALAKVLTNLKN